MMRVVQFLILVEIMIYTVHSGRSEMTCNQDQDWRNDWDGDHNNLQYSKFLAGMKSEHDNDKEDRRFQWDYCEPKGHNEIINVKELDQTKYDEAWVISCSGQNSGYSALIGAKSEHSNQKEDRIWTFYCGNVDTQEFYFAPGDCTWSTDWENDWDADIDYECPSDGLMRSISSWHDNHHEDRRWKFECCIVSDKSAGVGIPETYPKNPLPFEDPQDYIPYYPLSITNNSKLSWLMAIVFILVLINCICSSYYLTNKRKLGDKAKYKIVSIDSDSERQDLKL